MPGRAKPGLAGLVPKKAWPERPGQGQMAVWRRGGRFIEGGPAACGVPAGAPLSYGRVFIYGWLAAAEQQVEGRLMTEEGQWWSNRQHF